MKSPYTIIKTLAALVTVLPLTALAAGPTASQGVLLMGFRSTDAGLAGNGTYIVVNIGQAATYRDGTAAHTIANINTQLSETFGPNWASRTDIQWSVSGITGTSDPDNTLYLSRAQTAVGVPTACPTISGPSQRATIASNINDALGLSSAGMGFDDSSVSTYNSLVGVEDGTLPNNWRVFMGPGGTIGKAGGTGASDFGWDGTGIETTPLKSLSLFRFGGDPTKSVIATYLGYFKIETNGTVSFNASVTYNSWKSVVNGQSANQDYDGDGIPNGVEWFMGTNGNGFTPNPQITAGKITWPRAVGNATPSSVKIQTSTDLQIWQDTVKGLESGTGPVIYTLPTGLPRFFVRLYVMP